MSLASVPNTLETDRLTLRHRRVGEAAIYHQLWTERDPRVPPHRRINPEGRPTVEDIAAEVRAERENSGSGILAVERKGMADVIGYCGLIFHENASPDEFIWRMAISRESGKSRPNVSNCSNASSSESTPTRHRDPLDKDHRIMPMRERFWQLNRGGRSLR